MTGVVLRAARPADADDVARVHVRAWQAAYRGLLADDYLATLRPEERARRYDFETTDPARPQTIVAVDGETLCGFVTTAPARDPDVPGSGEIAALNLAPEAWGRGLGRQLISAARARLVERGFSSAVLWVLVGNVRAERFYAADGWQLDGARKVDEVWGVSVDERRYRRDLP